MKQRCLVESTPVPTIYVDELVKLHNRDWDNDSERLVQSMPTFTTCKTSLYTQRTSRFTVVVLTRGFLNDCWGKYKSQAAFSKLLEEDKSRRFIAMYIDLQDQQIPNEFNTMKQILQIIQRCRPHDTPETTDNLQPDNPNTTNRSTNGNPSNQQPGGGNKQQSWIFCKYNQMKDQLFTRGPVQTDSILTIQHHHQQLQVCRLKTAKAQHKTGSGQTNISGCSSNSNVYYRE
ncbi:unnamed protein product [Mytilus edulis]|uniref:TIR domain-containing protein n=1 Tax=Mytilus edulis TaxID=6550 RepID=A0A8S3QFM8_MYTED|nr:unnamed protein product [Mytilus edulis]